jgi:hypothetical protein
VAQIKESLHISIFENCFFSAMQLLQKVALYELLKETTPYLLHPNLWIRQATAAFVSSTAKILDGVDVVVKLGTILTPYMKHSVIQMHNPALILHNVESPIPRPVMDGIVKTLADTLQEFMNLLEERQTARTMSKTNIQVLYSEMPPNIKPLFRRLASDGMVPSVEDKLLYMKDNLVKVSRHRALKTLSEDEGVLDLGRVRIPKKAVPLDVEVRVIRTSVALEVSAPSGGQLQQQQVGDQVNDEWKHMFSMTGEEILAPKIITSDSAVSSRTSSPALAAKKINPDLGRLTYIDNNREF